MLTAISANELPPLFKPIRVDVDAESWRAHLSVPGMIEASGGRFRDRVPGNEHRIQIGLPHGFEYHLAEIWQRHQREHGRDRVRREGDLRPIPPHPLEQSGDGGIALSRSLK